MLFNELKKNLKKSTEGYKVIKLALLADSSSQLITQAIKGYGVEDRVDYKVFESDYNQVDRQVFDLSSELYSYKPDFIIIVKSSEALLKAFYQTERDLQITFATDQAAYLKLLCDTLTDHFKSKIITNTYIEINDGVFGNYATKTEQSFIYQVKKLNLLLMDTSRELKNLFLFDLSSIAFAKGYSIMLDAKMYINADMILSIDILPVVAKSIHDIIQAVNGVFKKCIILDLDNTIWGGIIGDDGMEGIKIGNLGIGKSFTEFQFWIKELIKRGIIVAICTKNEESVAKEPFINHPDMILHIDDIAVFAANWENKVDNINYIQSVLNIGFDSIVFFDDNPVEREMVKHAIPQITVPVLPEDPSEYLPFLRQLNLFETVSFTVDDIVRTRHYQEEAKRKVVQKRFANEDEFLQSLSMESELKAFDKFTIPRVAQLSQRSNQFNLRTIRYTEEELIKIASDDKYITLSFTLKDNFSDNGVVCIIILQEREYALFIDTWIMSCRVLKRGMENFVLNNVVETALSAGFKKLTGEYIPTGKNMIVKEHYEGLDFTKKENLFTLDVCSYLPKKNFIKRKGNGFVPRNII